MDNLRKQDRAEIVHTWTRSPRASNNDALRERSHLSDGYSEDICLPSTDLGSNGAFKKSPQNYPQSL